MVHKSRLGCVVIECHTDHVEHAAGFWSQALGHPSEINEEGNFATLFDPDGSVAMIVQGVADEPTVHLDIETDDLQAEIRRLEKIGARKLGVFEHTVVMVAPTGHHFRVTAPRTATLGHGANSWPET